MRDSRKTIRFARGLPPFSRAARLARRLVANLPAPAIDQDRSLDEAGCVPVLQRPQRLDGEAQCLRLGLGERRFVGHRTRRQVVVGVAHVVIGLGEAAPDQPVEVVDVLGPYFQIEELQEFLGDP